MADLDISPQGSNQSSPENTFIFIKILINSAKANTYGLAFIKINYDTHKVDQVEAVLSQFSQYTQGLSSGSPWYEISDFVANHKMSGEYASKISDDLDNIIKEVTGDDAAVKNLVKYHDKQKYDEIAELFMQPLGRILFDRNVKMDIGSEFILQTEIDNYFEEKQKQYTGETSEAPAAAAVTNNIFDIGDDKVLLPCAPIVAPVSGIPIFEIRPGMEIMVKILNNTVDGNKYNQLFNLNQEDGKILPVKASIEKAVYEDGEYKILANIQGNVYAKVIETEQIKLKQYDPEEAKIEKHEAAISGSSKLYYFIAGGVIAVILLLIYFLIGR